MRTPDEIQADLDGLLKKDVEKMNACLDRATKVLLEKVGLGEPYEKWLALQFQGHLQVIYELSTHEPIPIDQTMNALTGNLAVAGIIVALAWPGAEDFKAIADDMMQHFQEVVRLKTELQAIVNPVPAMSAMPETKTIH